MKKKSHEDLIWEWKKREYKTKMKKSQQKKKKPSKPNVLSYAEYKRIYR